MQNEQSVSQINEWGRNQAANEVVAKNPGIQHDPMAFIRAVGKKFVEKQLDRFPEMCEIARVQNILAFKHNEKYGKKGKYTESYGWSEDGTFKFDYQIPQELYYFMVNMVYDKFWEQDNERVWRKFMKRICDGENAIDCLMQVKKMYGSQFKPLEKAEIYGPDNRPISK